MDEQDEEIANLLPKIKIMEQYYGRVEELALSLYNRRQDIKLTPEQNRVYVTKGDPQYFQGLKSLEN